MSDLTIRVLTNRNKSGWDGMIRKGGRLVQEGDVVKMNAKTVWVRLEDGHIVKRRKDRDLL